MHIFFNDGWVFAKKHLDSGMPLLKPQDFYGKEPDCFASIQIPHDWLISNTNDLYEDSVGFYKKSFFIEKKESKRFALRFEGVYMNWCVYINGTFAFEWKYGYTTVESEITQFVKAGENQIELIAVYQNPNTRWYSGAGIFRDVYLVTTEEVRIADGGTYFVTKKTDDAWKVTVRTEIDGDASGVSVQHELVSSEGTKLSFESASERFENKVHVFEATVRNAPVWSVDSPLCCTLATALSRNGKTLDEEKQTVGFRTICFDANKGFLLNGKLLKLHGVCQHHDLGLLGAAFDKTALERQFIKLKAMGVNALRTSHNAPAPYFMELADRMGFLVVDECFDMWERAKTTYDYSNYFAQWYERDLRALIRRDRNHPCLIMWSVGNEIYDTHFPEGLTITKNLVAVCRHNDPEKNAYVTIGSNFMPWEGAQHCADEIDTVGYNYTERMYAEHHAAHPSWCIYGSETASTVQSRSIYHFPYTSSLMTYADHQCSSLGNCTTSWGAKNTAYNITQDRDCDFCAGQFVWTGWDYIGEPTPYHTKNSYFGQIDTAGFEKDSFYQYKAAWVDAAKDPFVHVLPYWDFNDGQLIDIRVYSNAPFVELFVNDVSLGKKQNDVANGKDLAVMWQNVPYKKGSLCAVAYDANGKELARDMQRSFEDSDSVTVVPEQFTRNGLHFLVISTVDKNNVPVCNARSQVTVTVSGDAVLCGMDNGDSTDYDPYQSKDGKTLTRNLFGNRLIAMVKETKSNASFTVSACSSGLYGIMLSFKNGVLEKTQRTERSQSAGYVPVRKILLTCSDSRELNAQNKIVTVHATVLPLGASDKTLTFVPMMTEGVASDCAVLAVNTTSDGADVTVTARSDGAFRFTAMANNNSEWPQVMSELEFAVAGLGTANRNPYELVQACKCSQSSAPVKLSFDGGVQTEQGESWYLFDSVDFGVQGSDRITVPVFLWETDADFSLWEGIPGNGGIKIMDCHHHAPVVANEYASCTYTLPYRLFGVHDLCISTATSLSLQGFVFEKSAKAFAKLRALDCNSLVGDSFVRTEDAVEQIGNNVSIVFEHMDFGEKAASSITICGRSHVDNTIHVRFSGAEGDVNKIVAFSKNESYEERNFTLDCPHGLNTVTFVFLPGSNFDFKWFRFS